MRYVALALLIGCGDHATPLGADASGADASCTWDPPIELTEFGDAVIEHQPAESADGRELWFVTGDAPREISYAARASLDAPFVVQPLPAFDDPGADDTDPAISADGLHLTFASNRHG